MTEPILTIQQAKIVLLYAKHSMDACATGKEMFMADGTIHYHLRIVKKKTGLDPKRFYDLCRLVGMAAQIANAQQGGNK